MENWNKLHDYLENILTHVFHIVYDSVHNNNTINLKTIQYNAYIKILETLYS